ncbi:MAG: hypothetical protein DRI79_13060 [Chloroflexi bacterium]|nr:MAG: hypothetical protein DRI79_13060 [Chloroflexota bacterium]
MTKRTLIVIAGAVLCTLLLAGVALAMSSDNYRLDWFTPLTGGGGGAASSTNYAVNLTVGQTVIGVSESPHYQGCLGYWCGEFEHRVYLPLLLRDYP